MELNNYQKQVMCDLSAYLDCVNRGTNLFSAWREYWFSKDVAVGFGGVPSYNNSIERAPHVCMKVPTGGTAPSQVAKQVGIWKERLKNRAHK